jgi:hypothetical protein
MPEIGLAITLASGMLIRNRVLARAGQHAALEQAEDEAVGDQLAFGLHEGGRERHHAPEQHQGQDHPFCAPHRGDAAGRDLQDDVAPEEHAGGEADRLGAEAELAAHGGDRHRDVGAVDE